MDVIPRQPDFTNISLGRIHLQNTVDACARTLRIVQKSITFMNTGLTGLKISDTHEYSNNSFKREVRSESLYTYSY